VEEVSSILADDWRKKGDAELAARQEISVTRAGGGISAMVGG